MFQTVILLTLSETSPGFYKSFENTAGKGEIARNDQFLLFPTVFFTHLENFLPFSSNLKISSANSFNLEESKICRLEKGYDENVRKFTQMSRKTLWEKEHSFSQSVFKRLVLQTP